MSDEILFKKNLIHTFAPYLSVIATTAMAVFWIMNYVNSPINRIETQIASIDNNVQQLTDAKIVYDKTNEAQMAKLQQLNEEFAVMSQQLVDRGIISK